MKVKKIDAELFLIRDHEADTGLYPADVAKNLQECLGVLEVYGHLCGESKRGVIATTMDRDTMEMDTFSYLPGTVVGRFPLYLRVGDYRRVLELVDFGKRPYKIKER